MCFLFPELWVNHKNNECNTTLVRFVVTLVFYFIGNFVPIKKKELNARAKISANGGNAHGRNKALCFFLPLCISSKYTIILWSGCGEAALFSMEKSS